MPTLDLPETAMDPSLETRYVGRTARMLLVAMACVLGLCAVVLSLYLGTVQPAAAQMNDKPAAFIGSRG
jgi:hypothetical protein